MPAKDGTGPEGKGPKTGRGLGNCNTNNTQTKDSKFGRGFGPGKGLGFRNQNTNND